MEEKLVKNKVSAEKLVKTIKKESVIYLPKDKILSYLKEYLPDFEVLIIMGAGDIYNLAKVDNFKFWFLNFKLNPWPLFG